MIYKEIKVMSLNVNGLGNPVKRAKVMSKVKKDKAQIFCKRLTFHKLNMRN